MAGNCFPLVGGRVMRVTRLDKCGRPDDSDCAQVTSDGFVSIATTANIDAGTAITVTNAAGKNCVNQPACPQLTGYSLVFTFCDVDPDLFAMMSGQETILDPQTGQAIGFVVDVSKSACDSGFAVEVWSKVPGVTCPVDDQGNPIENADEASGYILWPFLQGGVIGDFTIENGAVSFVIQGASTMDGNGWGKGPYDVMLGMDGSPGPLTNALGPKAHMAVLQTFVAPPEPTCGCAPLEGWTITGVTAGTPGTFAPAQAPAPANLAALKADPVIGDAGTSKPGAVWTTGQYVVLDDSSQAHWSGTAWLVGKA